jgi:hypothetical protein
VVGLWGHRYASKLLLFADTRVLIVGQSRRLRHEIILFRDARGPRSRDSVVFDGGFVIAHPFK